MIKRAYIDILQSLSSGGPITDEGRLNYKLMGALLDASREKAITMFNKASRALPSELLQTTILNFKSDMQESDCYTVYKIPSPVIQRDVMSGSFNYVGSENGNTRFYIEKSLESFSSNMDDQIISKIYSSKPVVVYIPEFNLIRLNKNPGSAPKKIMVRGVFVYPSNIPEYNEAIDNYPITNNIFALAKEIFLKETLGPTLGAPANNISNSAEDSSVQKQNK